MAASPHILVVDDDREIRDLVSRLLKKEGLRVSTAADGVQMHRELASGNIDLIVLDLMLPGDDGLTLCRQLRATSAIPIIMLTAKGDEFDRVLGLEMGADDYLPKPFSSRELLARIKAVLRRAVALPPAPDSPASQTLQFEGWTFDTQRRELVSGDDVVVPLSTGEYDLLLALVSHQGRVLSRDQLLDLARGRSAGAFDRSIDTQVSRLRRKLETDPKNPEIIKTVWGGGYVFSPKVTGK
ncbi:MAG: response regulator [Rhodospirillaceae bacterium]|jgi:two-component system, OmpR family, response regulator|nr:response regulator [Rhodospirillaceae bacterium]MBT5456948.1 response regulator [Rhodospirillaceae bacterium]